MSAQTGPGPDIDRAALAAIQRVMRPLARWQERQRERLDPQPGSDLAGDDALTSPVQLSHLARGSLGQAADHLDAIRTLLFEAQRLHTWAPYTLARGALENAATAVWLLAPEDRETRVHRRLRLRVQDLRDEEEFFEDAGLTPVRDVAADRELVRQLARDAGVKTDNLFARGPTFTRILDEAQGPAGLSTARALWRLSSGIAHGRQWATLSSALAKDVVHQQDDVATVAYTADETVVLGVVNVAVRMTDAGWRLLDRRRLRFTDH